MYSVLWTDALQGIIMFGVAILMVSLPFIYVGGVDELMTKIATTDHATKAGQPIRNELVSFGMLVSFMYILSIDIKQISDP